MDGEHKNVSHKMSIDEVTQLYTILHYLSKKCISKRIFSSASLKYDLKHLWMNEGLHDSTLSIFLKTIQVF